jgi:hypothetical protein
MSTSSSARFPENDIFVAARNFDINEIARIVSIDGGEALTRTDSFDNTTPLHYVTLYFLQFVLDLSSSQSKGMLNQFIQSDLLHACSLIERVDSEHPAWDQSSYLVSSTDHCCYQFRTPKSLFLDACPSFDEKIERLFVEKYPNNIQQIKAALLKRGETPSLAEESSGLDSLEAAFELGVYAFLCEIKKRELIDDRSEEDKRFVQQKMQSCYQEIAGLVEPSVSNVRRKAQLQQYLSVCYQFLKDFDGSFLDEAQNTALHFCINHQCEFLFWFLFNDLEIDPGFFFLANNQYETPLSLALGSPIFKKDMIQYLMTEVDIDVDDISELEKTYSPLYLLLSHMRKFSVILNNSDFGEFPEDDSLLVWALNTLIEHELHRIKYREKLIPESVSIDLLNDLDSEKFSKINELIKNTRELMEYFTVDLLSTHEAARVFFTDTAPLRAKMDRHPLENFRLLVRTSEVLKIPAIFEFTLQLYLYLENLVQSEEEWTEPVLSLVSQAQLILSRVPVDHRAWFMKVEICRPGSLSGRKLNAKDIFMETFKFIVPLKERSEFKKLPGFDPFFLFFERSVEAFKAHQRELLAAASRAVRSRGAGGPGASGTPALVEGASGVELSSSFPPQQKNREPSPLWFAARKASINPGNFSRLLANLTRDQVIERLTTSYTFDGSTPLHQLLITIMRSFGLSLSSTTIDVNLIEFIFFLRQVPVDHPVWIQEALIMDPLTLQLEKPLPVRYLSLIYQRLSDFLRSNVDSEFGPIIRDAHTVLSSYESAFREVKHGLVLDTKFDRSVSLEQMVRLKMPAWVINHFLGAMSGDSTVWSAKEKDQAQQLINKEAPLVWDILIQQLRDLDRLTLASEGGASSLTPNLAVALYECELTLLILLRHHQKVSLPPLQKGQSSLAHLFLKKGCFGAFLALMRLSVSERGPYQDIYLHLDDEQETPLTLLFSDPEKQNFHKKVLEIIFEVDFYEGVFPLKTRAPLYRLAHFLGLAENIPSSAKARVNALLESFIKHEIGRLKKSKAEKVLILEESVDRDKFKLIHSKLSSNKKLTVLKHWETLIALTTEALLPHVSRLTDSSVEEEDERAAADEVGQSLIAAEERERLEAEKVRRNKAEKAARKLAESEEKRRMAAAEKALRKATRQDTAEKEEKKRETHKMEFSPDPIRAEEDEKSLILFNFEQFQSVEFIQDNLKGLALFRGDLDKSDHDYLKEFQRNLHLLFSNPKVYSESFQRVLEACRQLGAQTFPAEDAAIIQEFLKTWIPKKFQKSVFPSSGVKEGGASAGAGSGAGDERVESASDAVVVSNPVERGLQAKKTNEEMYSRIAWLYSDDRASHSGHYGWPLVLRKVREMGRDSDLLHPFLTGSCLDLYRNPVDLDLVIFLRDPESFKENCEIYLKQFQADFPTWKIKVMQSNPSFRQEDFYQLQLMDAAGKSIADMTFYPLRAEESLFSRLTVFSQRAVINKTLLYDLKTSTPYEIGDVKIFHARRNPFQESVATSLPIDFKALALLMKEWALRNPSKPISESTKVFLEELKFVAKARDEGGNPKVMALKSGCVYLLGVYFPAQTVKSQEKIKQFLVGLVGQDFFDACQREAHRREAEQKDRAIEREAQKRTNFSHAHGAPAQVFHGGMTGKGARPQTLDLFK